jgi:2-methylisocitrate lyase-like PEP mutase family enzyme
MEIEGPITLAARLDDIEELWKELHAYHLDLAAAGVSRVSLGPQAHSIAMAAFDELAQRLSGSLDPTRANDERPHANNRGDRDVVLSQ